MIDLDQVRKVAHLARLELTPDEELQFTTQLGDILEYFEQLSELDTEKCGADNSSNRRQQCNPPGYARNFCRSGRYSRLRPRARS